MSPQGPNYPTSASNQTVTGNNWVTPSNAEVSDGTFTTAAMPGGGDATDYLLVTGFGFSIPSTAIIDGVFAEIQVQGSNAATGFIGLVMAGSTTGFTKSDFPTPGTVVWPGSEAWLSYGGSADVWGATLAPSDINNGGFGIWLQTQNTHGGGSGSVDAIRVTIYWHAAPTNIPRTKYHLYKVYDSQTGAYLGNLPNVSSEFALAQDINTAGAQITVSCGVSADTSALPVDVLTDEAGNILTDEGSSNLTDEGQDPQTGTGTSGAIIRDGNIVEVWEYGYYHINGILMFRGTIERHTDNFGGDTGDDNVVTLIYSDGSDMDNHLVRGAPFSTTNDVSQTSQNTSGTVSQSVYAGWNRFGQTWKVGVAVTNLGAITIMLNGAATVTVSIYTDASLGTLLGTVTQSVNVGGATAIQFPIVPHIPVTAGSTYFFTVSCAAGQSISIYYQNTSVYANGDAYESSYAGGAGGGAWGPVVPVADLYFVTASSNGSTIATFTSVDPSAGMLQTIMSDYKAEGGLIGIGNIQASGLSLNYGLNTNTVYEGVKGALSVSPNGFYYYVDLGADLLYFQKANTVADYVLTKGVHINKLSIVSTIEYVINACYTVGAVVAGSNIYTLDTDPSSIDRYGLRLQVHTDNNIPDTTTAHAVGSSIVEANSSEQYQTQVTILDKTMDTTLLIPGKVIGFNGFGTYVDGLLAQIVHRDYGPDSVTLTLGVLPKRTTVAVEQVIRGLTALNTVTNPTSPS